MYNKLIFIALAAFIQSNLISGQRQWVPDTLTAEEMSNPYTWYLPYAKAAAEGYKEFFKQAQKITNELYKQAYITDAFPWAQNQAGQAMGQAGQMAGQAGQTAGQATGQLVKPNGQGGQGGQWNGQGGQNWY